MKNTGIPVHMNTTGLTHFLFGAAYYPEHWSEDERKLDVERMKAAYFNTVRMGEFAWSVMEREEGKFDFSFFKKVIGKLGRAGIDTVFCTPTPAPPAWLTHRHPDVLRVDANGKSMKHGSRQHCCLASKTFRKFSKRLTERMAKAFKDDPHVIGWQTDNEIFCHFRECYCDSCREGFREYVKKKYGTIDRLNEDWGASFWNLTYNSFDEVDLPYPDRPTTCNPTHLLDYRHFLSDAAILFQKEQGDILRKENEAWWVTHNSYFSIIDYYKFCKDLDFFGLDKYPMFYDKKKRASACAFRYDAGRSFKGNFIIPELQSGPGGWGEAMTDTPMPGEIRTFAYQTIARGAEGILHFRWRTCKFGAEQYWKGIFDQDNKVNRRYGEIAKEGEELKKIGNEVLGTYIVPDIAVLYDTGLFNNSHEPITNGLPSPVECAEVIHSAVYKNGYSVGCINPYDIFTGLKVIIMPSWGAVSAELVEKIEAFVSEGGVFVVTGRSGIKDTRSHVTGMTPPGLLSRVCGIEVEEPFRINDTDEYPNEIVFDKKKIKSDSIRASKWLETIRPMSAEVYGMWKNGYQKGKAGVTVNNYGKGYAVYIGTYLEEHTAALVISLMQKLAQVKKIIPGMPQGVEVSIRQNDTDKFYFIINHSEEETEIKNPPAGEYILSSDILKSSERRITIRPLGVVVIKKGA
ncbi:beta-galactosidase [Spirochaetota bacterium]